jgi:3-hydroxybutyrate dehydrogenase
MFENKVLLLTGASGGIGNAIMDHFTTKVQSITTSNRKSLDQFLINKIKPANLEHFTHDLTIEADVQDLFRRIENNGKLDILINCVGASLFSHPIENFPVEEFDKIISVNLRSAFLLTKHAICAMKNRGGNIIHFVSSSAKNIAPGKAPYGSAKAGLAHFIHYAASEAAQYNIKINGISPTYIFTPRHEAEIQQKMQENAMTREKIVEPILQRQLLHRPMYPADLLNVVELLASTESITGQIFNCCMGEILCY